MQAHKFWYRILTPSAIHSSSPHDVLLMHSDCDFRKLRLRDDDG